MVPIRYIISLTLGLFLAACGKTPSLPYLPQDAVIVAFGDSLTYGTGASPEESYPAVLSRLIQRRVINAGIPGELSAEGLARLPMVLDRHRPDLLILCHGGNDLLRHRDEQALEANLEAMVRLALDRGIPVVLIAVPRPSLSLVPPALYHGIAEAFGLPLEEEALPSILADPSLKADLAHPNASGYRRLADAVASLLREAGAID